MFRKAPGSLKTDSIDPRHPTALNKDSSQHDARDSRESHKCHGDSRDNVAAWAQTAPGSRPYWGLELLHIPPPATVIGDITDTIYLGVHIMLNK